MIDKTKYKDAQISPSPDTGKKVYVQWIKRRWLFFHKMVTSEGEYLGTIPFITPTHPVIYLPDARRMILGCECWWSFDPPAVTDTPNDHVIDDHGVITRVVSGEDATPYPFDALCLTVSKDDVTITATVDSKSPST